MGAFALAVAAAAVGLVAWVGPGSYVAVGLAVIAIAAGTVGWRRVGTRPGARLGGAAAVALGSIALLLAGTKIALTFVAIERLARVFH